MLAAGLLGGSAASPAGRPSIRLESGRFVVDRLPAGLGAADFAVYVDGAEQPMLGSASVAGRRLRFEPRFPLQPGLRYRAVLRSKPPLSSIFEIPRAAPATVPRVERVYPSIDKLPENLLRFYLHFSEPMSRGEVYRRVHLVEASGAEVEAPFLELEQELWDPSGTRLTLLLDPARIKRGLVPNREVGLPLEANHSYALVIDAEWPSAAGQPLEAAYRKSFLVVRADRKPPDPRNWKLRAPRGGSREPLSITFPESLDRALLDRMLAVRGSAGDAIEGSVSVDAGELRWSFTPTGPWRPDAYTLAVDPELEDVAGNRIGRPFDVDLRSGGEPEIPEEMRALRFEVP